MSCKAVENPGRGNGTGENEFVEQQEAHIAELERLEGFQQRKLIEEQAAFHDEGQERLDQERVEQALLLGIVAVVVVRYAQERFVGLVAEP